jgi:cystathionine beta-synthase
VLIRKKWAENIKEPKNIVVIFADSGRAYLSKAFNDNWMIESGLLDAKNTKDSFNRVVSAKDMVAELDKNKGL